MKRIMFNDRYGLAQAVLEGRKTMTRRAVRFPTKFDWGFCRYPLKPVTREGYRAFVELLDEDEFSFEPERYVGSQYEVGEIVAIAQRYEDLANGGYLDIMMDGKLSMKKEYSGAGYKNKMFVRAEYMPHHIKITDIKVEALADISDDDCLKEGITHVPVGINNFGVRDLMKGVTYYYRTPYQAYKELIDRLNKRGFFESNPIVYAYTYELID